MAFQVTPETDAAEAAMFHGARLALDSNYALAGADTVVPFDLVEYDTDGFWDAANNRFEIPEGVVAVELGASLRGLGASNSGIEVSIRASNGSRGTVRLSMDLAMGTTILAASCSASTGPISTEAGERFDVLAREINGAQVLQGGLVTYPNNFWLKVIKTPFGRPDSPTLP